MEARMLSLAGDVLTSIERQYPRTRFTRALERMCKRLDKQSTFEVEEDIEDIGLVREIITIHELWVVGSYARGARHCGDLDTVTRFTCDNGKNSVFSAEKTLRRAFGQVPGVCFYSGTPEANNACVSFSEAVQIWTPGSDWRAAIAAIKVDPTAQRFIRPTDVVPLRQGQMRSDFDDRAALTELYNDDVLAWRFVPIGAAPEPLELTDEEKSLQKRARRWGRRTQLLLPYVIEYFRGFRRHCDTLRVGRIELGSVSLGGIHVVLGCPSPGYQLLDTLTCSRLALVPHLSHRGPNGLWEIRRGPKHPIEIAFSDIGAFVLVDKAGRLRAVQQSPPEAPDDFANVVELFGDETSGRRVIDETLALDNADSGEGSNPLHMICVSGSELLDVISHADIIEIVSTKHCAMFSLTRDGARANDEEHFAQPSIVEIQEALRKARPEP